MNDPILVATRHHYDSYEDFWELVRLSGFRVCHVDEVRLDAGETFIVTPCNGEFVPHFTNERVRVPESNSRLIWWCLERPDAPRPSKPLPETVDEIWLLIDAAWVSDRSVAALDSRVTHVVLGGHKDLRARAPEQPLYDYCHLSYAWGRRADILRFIQARGLREAPNGWGDEKARILSSSRLLINAQQYPMGVIAPLRFALAASHRLPVLTERVGDPYPHVIGHDLAQADYDQLPAMAADLLGPHNNELRRNLGNNLYETLCEKWTFRHGIEEGLARTQWRVACT